MHLKNPPKSGFFILFTVLKTVPFEQAHLEEKKQVITSTSNQNTTGKLKGDNQSSGTGNLIFTFIVTCRAAIPVFKASSGINQTKKDCPYIF